MSPNDFDRLDDDALGAALRGADVRARPEFRADLRARFVDGSLLEAPAPAAPAPVRPLRRPALPYAAAAVLLVGLGLAARFGMETDPAGSVPAVIPPTPIEVAVTAAERRIASLAPLADATLERREVRGHPFLVAAGLHEADPGGLDEIAETLEAAETVLARELPEIADRAPWPPVAVVAPTREAFEAVVAPRIAPLAVHANIVAFNLDRENVLLVSPDVMAPGGTRCEAIDLVHEGVHQWLHARRTGERGLPLWVDEGVAELVSQSYARMDSRRWALQMFRALAEARLEPFSPDDVLGAESFPAVAEHARSVAPCETRPFALLPAFHGHAVSLVLFLTDDADQAGAARRERFTAFLARVLEGEAFDPQATAAALGFASPAALFAARDAWLGLEQ